MSFIFVLKAFLVIFKVNQNVHPMAFKTILIFKELPKVLKQALIS